MVKICRWQLCNSDTHYPFRLEAEIRFMPCPKPCWSVEICNLRWIEPCDHPLGELCKHGNPHLFVYKHGNPHLFVYKHGNPHLFVYKHGNPHLFVYKHGSPHLFVYKHYGNPHLFVYKYKGQYILFKIHCWISLETIYIYRFVSSRLNLSYQSQWAQHPQYPQYPLFQLLL